jgi:signal transduction histidine kinase
MMIILYFMVRRASDLVNSHQKSLVQKMNEAENLAVQNDKLRREADDARLESASAIESLLGRIGQDLHDGPIQLLSLLMLNLPDSSEGEAGAKSASDAPHHISLQGLSARILAELRDISTGLVLPELDELTATQTVLLAVHQHEEVTGTEVQCRIENLPEDLALSLKICLYRIVQEGLNNAFKYAQGIGQCVEASADERKISIAVSDKGPGFPENDTDKTRTRTGLGLAGLKNRVAALKGSFESRSQPGVGTALRARLPIARLGS